jgi:predicted Zn-dependent protease
VSLVGALVLLAAPAAAGPLVVAPAEGLAPDEAWIAEAVADELPRDLHELGVSVIERYDRLRVQERLGLPAVRLTRATQVRVAEASGAWRLVTTTVEREGSQLVLKVRLLDVARGALAAPLVARGPVEALADLLAGLAFDIALAGPTPPARSREVLLTLRKAVPFEAWKAHAEALAAPDPAEVAKGLRRALNLFPGYEEARVDLARQQLEEREYAQALATLPRADHARPGGRAARFAEGVALIGLGRYAEASTLYAELRQAVPTPAVLANEGAALLRLKKRGSPAWGPLRQALQREPGALDLPVSLGFALLHENEPAAAAFFLRAATRRDPRDAAARLLLTWALRLSGRGTEADEEWRDLQALTDAFASLPQPDLQRRFERILASEGALVVEPEANRDAELAAAHQARGEKLLQEGDAASAAAELLRATVLDPFDPRPHLLLARASRGRGDVVRAEDELRASLYCREDPAVRVELADLLLARGQESEARKEAARVLEVEPGNAAARRLLEDRP